MKSLHPHIKALLVFASVIMLQGCIAHLTYQTELETVQVDHQPQKTEKGVYHDDSVIISTELDTTLKILIANLTDRTMRVLWDESRFVDPMGAVHRVLPGGVRYAARNDVLSPAIILPKQKFTTVLTNTSNVRLVGEGTSAMQWQDRGMLPSLFAPIDGKPEPVADAYVGKVAKLHLVVEADGKRREYELGYKINGYQKGG